MFLSERSERNQRIAGAAFGEHLRAAGAHRRLAPDPILRGRVPSVGTEIPAVLRFDHAFFSSRPTGACFHTNLRAVVF